MMLRFENTYVFEHRDKAGALQWTEIVRNLVTTEGLTDVIAKYFKGAAYTATWYVGLINNDHFAALDPTDIAANITTSNPTGGTNGWKEYTGYSEGNRQTLTLGTVASGAANNTASPCVFTITSAVSLKGAFIDSTNTKGGTTGVLFGEAAFNAVRTISSGTLTVKIFLSAVSG